MQITKKLEPRIRSRLRAWFERNHNKEREVWILYRRGNSSKQGEITYLDIVEECICFGWIDGLAKTYQGKSAQRLTPRRPKSNWSELNKERARRLIASGLMHDAGLAVLPNLDTSEFKVPRKIELALKEDDDVWRNFCSFPPLYKRVRISYIAETLKRNNEEYQRRLNNFLKKTKENKLYGNWDDSRMKRTNV